MEELIDQASDMIAVIEKNPNFIPGLARLMKRLYDELIVVGFSEEQAARIVANYKAVGQ